MNETQPTLQNVEPEQTAVAAASHILNFLRNFSISAKIGGAFTVMVILTLLLGVTNLFIAQIKSEAVTELADTQSELTLIEAIRVDIAQMRQLEQQFLLNWEEQGFDAAYQNYIFPFIALQTQIPGKVTALQNLESNEEIPNQVNLDILARTNQAVPQYGSQFLNIVEALKLRGSRDTGLKGAFNQAIVQLDSLTVFTDESEMRIFMDMRQNAVRWLLYKDVNSVSAVRSDAAQLKELVAASDFPEETRVEAAASLDAYLEAFDELVAADIQVRGLLNRFDAMARAVDLPAERVVENEQEDAAEAFDNFNSAERLEQSLGLITLLASVALGITLAITTTRNIVGPLAKLTRAAESISAGDLSARAEIAAADEIGMLGRTFNTMAQQLGHTLGQLEERVAERTRALQASVEVSNRLSTILDPQKLLLSVVEEIKTAFNYYHVHIYLFDEDKERLMMAGGTGEAGEAMMAARHSIQEGQGLVGRAAAANEVALVPDVAQAEGWLPNPLLPDTRAEIAVPIAVGDDVLGVLDVQHDVTQGLGEEDVSLLQSVANQVAVAVQNARQFDRTERRAQQGARINAIAQRINSAVTIEDVLQIAAAEVGQATGARRASVQLTNPSRTFQPSAPQNGRNGSQANE